MARECAWVLWSGTLTEPMQWYPLDAFSSRNECHERLEAVGRHMGGVYKCLPTPSTRVGQRGSEHARAYPHQYREVSHLRVSGRAWRPARSSSLDFRAHPDLHEGG